ncbi:MAG: Lrp/AsnC family transcriptional regulator [Thalassotalea sp.]
MNLTLLERDIINHYQKGFPVCEAPYQVIAEQLGTNEEAVLLALNTLDEKGALSRIGPVFDHKKAGASTLAAMAVEPEQLDEVAAIVNQFQQVNHNYEREHYYNLWFVVTASDLTELDHALAQIESMTGLAILVLPMEASYHIDLGFHINFDHLTSTGSSAIKEADYGSK